jgi:hypothetical protein
MFDLNIHRLLGADDISGAVWYMVNATHVEGPLNMGVTITVIQSASQICICFS